MEQDKTLIEAAKDQGYEVAQITISGKEYVVRAITRREWRDLMAARNDKLQAAGEDLKAQIEIQEDEVEKLVEMCLISPQTPVENMLAGVVDALSNEILALSGFAGADFEAVRL